MEDETDREERRFQVDFPGDELGGSEADLSDFSFEWEENAQFSDPEPVAGELESPFPELGVEAVETVRRALDASNRALGEYNRALDDNSQALRQISDAVYELASTVQLLITEVDGMGGARQIVLPEGSSGDIAATAMITISGEVTDAVDRLSKQVEASRNEVHGLMDDVVAAAGGGPREPRIVVELDRVRSELQSLKRRLPVRSKELDVRELADLVSEAVISAIDSSALVAPGAGATASAPAGAEGTGCEEGDDPPAPAAR